jgi:shikimate dehydrogenase
MTSVAPPLVPCPEPPAAAPRGAVLIGLIGTGIQASRSPALHEREAAAHGLRYLYQLIDLAPRGLSEAALPDLLAAAEAMGFRGLNITHPCKQAVIAHLDDLADSARAVGAVNTVLLEGGRRIGHNTDAYGFAESFRRAMPDAPRARVVQLGAGGAGAAVGAAMLQLGAGVLAIVDPERTKADALATRLAGSFGAGRAVVATSLSDALAAADGVVNASPIGMAHHPGLPLPRALLRRDLWVADVVYVPLDTELLIAARALGCRTLSGGGMAVFQAVEAFRLFTGIAPDPERMLRHFASL